MVNEIKTDMAAQIARVHELEANGKLAPMLGSVE